MSEAVAERPPPRPLRYQLDAERGRRTKAERAAYLGGSDVFGRAITEFAAAYADQNERDHAALVAAVASGRVTAERGL